MEEATEPEAQPDLEALETEDGPAGEPMVGVVQAARALGVTRSHAYAQLRSGKWRAVDIPTPNGGTRRMVPLAEVERLISERGARSHGPVRPVVPEETQPILELVETTQKLESTRRVLAEVVEHLEVEGETASMGWWKRRRAERDRVVRLEAALRAALAASGEVAPELGAPEREEGGETPSAPA